MRPWQQLLSATNLARPTSDIWWLTVKLHTKDWHNMKVINGFHRAQVYIGEHILVEKGGGLSIEYHFNGLIVGKPGSTIRINNEFSGFVYGDMVALGPKAKVSCNVVANTLHVSDQAEFEGGCQVQVSSSKDVSQMQLNEIVQFTPQDFEAQYTQKPG